MNSLNIIVHIILFFLKLEKVMRAKNKDYIVFYPLDCRKKKAPVFIWPYIDLVPHIEVQNLSSSSFSPKKTFFWQSCFLSKGFFQRKKVPWWLMDDRGWLVLSFWGKKQSICKIPWEVEPKGKFVLDRGEKYQELV